MNITSTIKSRSFQKLHVVQNQAEYLVGDEERPGAGLQDEEMRERFNRILIGLKL